MRTITTSSPNSLDAETPYHKDLINSTTMHVLSSIVTCLAATSITANALPQPANGDRNAVIPSSTSDYFMGTKVSSFGLRSD